MADVQAIQDLAGGEQQQQEQRPPRSKISLETARIVQLLLQFGPNMEEIARATGIFRETVRYRCKKRILGRGLTVHAVLDYERLGMSKMLVIARLNDELEPCSEAIMREMNKLCYLTGYWFVVPTGEYLLDLTIPNSLLAEVDDLFKRLEDLKVFTSLTLFHFRGARNPPMMTHYFDFDTGTWTYDWSTKMPRNIRIPGYRAVHLANYDYFDLVMLKELTADATRSQIKISDEFGVKTKTLGWHYCNHVQRNNLIKSYRVSWMGDRRAAEEEEEGRMEIPEHRYIQSCLLIKDASEGEMLEISTMLNQIPFLWEEAFGDHYYASLFIPANHYAEFLSYLLKFMKCVADRARLFTIEQRKSVSLPLPYHLYHRQKRTWQLDKEGVLAKMKNTFLKDGK
jgi:DNA-binding Lrp family transcriptional regulator